MTAGIYRINGPNDKVYIGSSVNINKRVNEHRRLLRKGTHSNQKLQHAWNKHGENAFTFHIVEEVLDKARLLYYEQVWLDILWTCLDTSDVYNICRDANGTTGLKLSQERIELLRSINKGNTYRRGAKLSAETKKKLSDAKKGKSTTTGMHCSEETRRKISEAQKRRLLNPELRKQISNKMMGNNHRSKNK